MSKIIIDNRSELVSDRSALRKVLEVLDMGKISDSGKQHCYVTSFPWDAKGETRIIVAAVLNKKSERFVIYDEAFND